MLGPNPNAQLRAGRHRAPDPPTVGRVFEYRELTVPDPLRDLLQCHWYRTVDRTVPVHRQRVVPDACIDLVRHGTELFVAGPDTSAWIATQPGGSAVTGLRFRPGAAPELFGVPASEITDRRVPLSDLDPTLARQVSILLERELPAPAALLRAVHARLPRTTGPDPATLRIIELTESGRGVADVADALGWTGRTLHRRCLSAFGYGPATLRRVLRLRAAITLARRGMPTAEVAVRTGYADQAHLSRDTKAMAGVTLTRLTR